MLFKYKITSKPLLVLALSLTSYSSYADQSHCGSGPYIEGGRGDNHIQIRPSGNRYFDSMNLKWAINNVSENGSIKLCEGTFDLVAHRFRKETSFKIRKNIAIQGVRDNDTLKTLTSFELGALIISILLHDVGMHIQYDGFKLLVTDVVVLPISNLLTPPVVIPILSLPIRYKPVS